MSWLIRTTIQIKNGRTSKWLAEWDLHKIIKRFVKHTLLPENNEQILSLNKLSWFWSALNGPEEHFSFFY